jgi:hypothetical protein
MRTHTSATLLGALALAATAGAQDVTVASAGRPQPAPADTASAKKDSAGAEQSGVASIVPQQRIQYMRANDARGINVFETTKRDTVTYRGFDLQFGGAFTQQFQGLGHRNAAQARVVNGVNANQLIALGHGFNNAVANLYLNAQLARGIRVALTSYLSARHHQEAWVKDGYLQVDASPLDYAPLNALMRYVTVKAGHFEINYGDAHFRRTDNGNAMYNPLVGNYVMDAFTTQVGGEVYVQARGRLDGLFAMGGVTNGEIRGTTLNAARRSPGYLTKVGFDRRLSRDLRVRLTGSTFAQARSANQTLYSGDRAGSRYYNVLENTAATEREQAWSGALNPGFNEMHAVVVNPFVEYRGLELFGNFERARGKAAVDSAARREFTQAVAEGTYRFLDDRLYVSGRYNAVKGRPANYRADVTVDRTQFGGGWFVNPLILLKGEWVDQRYDGFLPTDIRHGGSFKGFVVEGVVAF